MRTNSVSFAVDEYSRLIVFRDRKMFLEVLKVNPHLAPVYGHTEQDEECFPGLYVAGFKVEKKPMTFKLDLDMRKIMRNVLQEMRDKHAGD